MATKKAALDLAAKNASSSFMEALCIVSKFINSSSLDDRTEISNCMEVLFPNRIRSPEIYSKVMWFTCQVSTYIIAFLRNERTHPYFVSQAREISIFLPSRFFKGTGPCFDVDWGEFFWPGESKLHHRKARVYKAICSRSLISKKLTLTNYVLFLNVYRGNAQTIYAIS